MSNSKQWESANWITITFERQRIPVRVSCVCFLCQKCWIAAKMTSKEKPVCLVVVPGLCFDDHTRARNPLRSSASRRRAFVAACAFKRGLSEHGRTHQTRSNAGTHTRVPAHPRPRARSAPAHTHTVNGSPAFWEPLYLSFQSPEISSDRPRPGRWRLNTENVSCPLD